MTQRVRVSVPATSANLGAGFDCLGVALALRSEVELALGAAPQQPGAGEQMALHAASLIFRRLGRPLPALRVRLSGDVPSGRGLGASAIVRVGALKAAAALAETPLDDEQLLVLAAELEGHPDNAAPAVLGGLQVAVWTEERLMHARVPLPRGLAAVLFVPEFEMSTDEGRRLLPQSLSRRDVVFTSSRTALLVTAMATGRLDLLHMATQDVLHQPARAQLFPAMESIFAAAEQAGALCAYLSGGGSTLLALTDGQSDQQNERVAGAMAARAAVHGVGGKTMVTTLSEHGVEILEQA